MDAGAVQQSDTAVQVWIDAVVARHMRGFTTSEFLKAVRALSARYVERRSELHARSPIDSAGKRAAFAGFFAPLHYLTTRAAVRALDARVSGSVHVFDLGCGTGVVAAAWAAALDDVVKVTGVDEQGWVLDEARWNWRSLGVPGVTRRQSLVDFPSLLRRPRRERSAGPGLSYAIVLGWAVNELPAPLRAQLLPLLLAEHRRGTAILVLEPLARSAVPWWPSWERPVLDAGGRADEWKLPDRLPPALADLDEAAGFRREGLTARSLWLPGASVPGT